MFSIPFSTISQQNTGFVKHECIHLLYNNPMSKELEISTIGCPFRKKNKLCTSEIRLFKPLPLDVQEYLVNNSEHVQYPKGKILAHEGDQIDAVLIIRHGRIKTCRYDVNGEEYIMDILHEGQAIWHDMFLNDYKYHYDIVTLTDTMICKIKRTDFMRLLTKYPNAAMSLIAMLSTELQEAKEKTQLLSIRQPIIRLSGFLLNKDRTCTNHEIQMKLDDIAASIGLRPETVSRCISKLEKQKVIIRLGQGKLKVIDRQQLLEIYNSEKNI